MLLHDLSFRMSLHLVSTMIVCIATITKRELSSGSCWLCCQMRCAASELTIML
jgi:hypothetical protein